MKKISFIIILASISLIFTSCGQKEKVDTSQAPQEIRDAIEYSYQLSKELTDLQLQAASDMVFDESEISEIGESFRYLAIVNNINARDFSMNKYFIALRTEYKDSFDALADTVVFIKDCEGYDQLGLAIQQISLEVRDVVELPVIQEPEPEPVDTLMEEPVQE
ncbi:MAG TPA: hypothetical protein VK994_08150 [Bacteroidales bacterium]|nr:hypothetical protein [Bacteroidales bacterium]